MALHEPETRIFLPLPIDLSFDAFSTFLLRTAGGARLVEPARALFATSAGTCSAAAVFRLMAIDERSSKRVVLHDLVTGKPAKLSMGWSSRFLAEAEYVIAGAYTTGCRIEQEAAEAGATRRYLDSYILEQLGLLLLERTGQAVNREIEAVAARNGWGVGPLLSPGSVHGWELTDQPQLCALLPLAEIGISCGANAVLAPFNSLSVVIGIGPGYPDKTVGRPCTVCANRETCEFRQSE